MTLAGGVEDYTFTWTGPEQFSADTEDLSQLNDIGEYCVSIVDANGCQIDSCMNVLLRLQFGFGEIIESACADVPTGSITVDVLGGLEPYTFEWDAPGGDPNSPTLNNIAAGTYVVTVMDAEGSSITGSFEVGEFDAILVTETLTPAEGLINNTNGAISLDIAGGLAPYDVAWDNGMDTAEISGLSEGTYCVTVTDANACTFEACYDIQFIPFELEIIEIAPFETNCFGESNGRLFIEAFGGVPPYTLSTQVNGSDVTITSLSGEFEIENLPAGDYMITIVDGNGVEVQETATVVQPNPISLQDITVKHDTELTGPGIGSGRIQLVLTGGTPGYNIVWNNGAQGATIIGLDAETYTPVVTDSRGCELTFGGIVVEEFKIDLEGQAVVCTGDANGAIDLIITDGDEPYAYSWDLPGGGTASTEDLSDLPAGTYTVTVSEASGNSLTEMITIAPQSDLSINAEIETDFNGFDVSCPDATDGIVTANAIFNGANCTDCLYEWDLNGSLEGVDATLNMAQAGVYQLTVIDPLNCVTTTEVELAAPASLLLNPTIQEVSCPGEQDGEMTVMVTGGTGGFVQYLWSNGNASFQNTNLAPGVYALTVSDANQCEATANYEVIEPAPLEFNLQIEPQTDPEICDGSIWAVINGGNPPYSYDWVNLELATTEALAEGLCAGDYPIQVTDVRGCSLDDVAVVTSTAFDCLDERVVITPDGNGSNDEFILFCVEQLLDNHLEVYNRWGQLVFETDNYDNTWEGTSQNGDPLPEGPYYFILDYRSPSTGEMTQHRGSLTILKE